MEALGKCNENLQVNSKSYQMKKNKKRQPPQFKY